MSVPSVLAHFSWNLKRISTKNFNHHQHSIHFLTTLIYNPADVLGSLWVYHSKKKPFAKNVAVQELSGFRQWCRNGHPWWRCFQKKLPAGLSSWHPFRPSIELAALPIFEGLTNHKSRICGSSLLKLEDFCIGAKTKSDDRYWYGSMVPLFSMYMVISDKLELLLWNGWGI